ncbi:hypothetical protein ACTD5D_15650 [Nocardia takedensis]|uniref:hypothetical protein n=1 Tax=Nocardia takedensis TaxID=259390 RepID=UPI0002D3FBD5|nr:hypothetical protein [Nocardia takedensis]
MAEQYLSAFAVDPAALTALVGSGDRSVIDAALTAVPALTASGALLRVEDAGELDRALTEIVTGRLDPRRPGGYTWTLEALGPTVGCALGSATLPARGPVAADAA